MRRILLKRYCEQSFDLSNLSRSGTCSQPQQNCLIQLFVLYRTVVAGLSIMVLVTAGYPFISLFASNKVASLLAFCSLYSLQSLATNFCFASGNVMVNEAGMKPHVKDQIGSINGAGHMISSSVRAIGPAFAGILWSLVTASHLSTGISIPFLLCTVCALLEIRFYHLM